MTVRCFIIHVILRKRKNLTLSDATEPLGSRMHARESARWIDQDWLPERRDDQ